MIYLVLQGPQTIWNIVFNFPPPLLGINLKKRKKLNHIDTEQFIVAVKSKTMDSERNLHLVYFMPGRVGQAER